jgi:hypothetical protein
MTDRVIVKIVERHQENERFLACGYPRIFLEFRFQLWLSQSPTSGSAHYTTTIAHRTILIIYMALLKSSKIYQFCNLSFLGILAILAKIEKYSDFQIIVSQRNHAFNKLVFS